MKYCTFLLLAGMLFFGLHSSAQTKPVTRFKPPKLYTQLGTYRDSVTITVAEAEQLVAGTLKIFDDKKGIYTVSSYQLAYRKIGVTEEEPTEDDKPGKVTPTYTLTSALFKTTPLPAMWVQQLKEQVKPGDELWFFAVIAKDAQGRVMYAPDLKFRIVK